MLTTTSLTDYILTTRDERTAHIDLKEPCDCVQKRYQYNGRLFKKMCQLLSVSINIANREEAKIDVCHLCENRDCENPRHAYIGTRSENVQDRPTGKRSQAARKGAEKRQRGVQLIGPDGEMYCFGSLKSAAEGLGLDSSHLSKTCQGKLKSTKGYTATYWDG